jgi:hypothetical protein
MMASFQDLGCDGARLSNSNESCPVPSLYTPTMRIVEGLLAVKTKTSYYSNITVSLYAFARAPLQKFWVYGSFLF